jgi:hypothetical protein
MRIIDDFGYVAEVRVGLDDTEWVWALSNKNIL